MPPTAPGRTGRPSAVRGVPQGSSRAHRPVRPHPAHRPRSAAVRAYRVPKQTPRGAGPSARPNRRGGPRAAAPRNSRARQPGSPPASEHGPAGAGRAVRAGRVRRNAGRPPAHRPPGALPAPGEPGRGGRGQGGRGRTNRGQGDPGHPFRARRGEAERPRPERSAAARHPTARPAAARRVPEPGGVRQDGTRHRTVAATARWPRASHHRTHAARPGAPPDRPRYRVPELTELPELTAHQGCRKRSAEPEQLGARTPVRTPVRGSRALRRGTRPPASRCCPSPSHCSPGNRKNPDGPAPGRRRTWPIAVRAPELPCRPTCHRSCAATELVPSPLPRPGAPPSAGRPAARRAAACAGERRTVRREWPRRPYRFRSRRLYFPPHSAERGRTGTRAGTRRVSAAGTGTTTGTPRRTGLTAPWSRIPHPLTEKCRSPRSG